MSEGTGMTALEAVQEYHRAWTGGDLSGAMKYISDDIVCRAPAGNVAGKDAYREFLGGFAQQMTGLTDVAALGYDEQVMLFYYPHTAVTSEAPVAELFTVRDGQIVESLLIFDRLS